MLVLLVVIIYFAKVYAATAAYIKADFHLLEGRLRIHALLGLLMLYLSSSLVGVILFVILL